MDQSSEVMTMLEDAGAVIVDKHFVYKSWKHGSGYINMDMLFPDVGVIYNLCGRMMQPYKDDFLAGRIDTIASPATGAIVISVLCATYVHQHWGVEVAAIWADKDGDEFIFERAGFTSYLKGKNVLVVEDLATTGGSVLKVCRRAEAEGATIVGVSLVCNRGGVTKEHLVVPRLEQLATVSFEAINPEDCPLCRDEVPIVSNIGHGAEFKAANADYPGRYVEVAA